MGFFDPIDEEREDARVDDQPFVRPEWFGPPLGVVPGLLPATITLFADDRLALLLRRIEIFPTGLQMTLELFTRELTIDGRWVSHDFPFALVDDQFRHFHNQSPAEPDQLLRFGLRFGDGSSVQTTTDRGVGEKLRELIESNSSPTEPLILQKGGHGGEQHHSIDLWVWLPPTDGGLEVFVEWPAAEVPEASTVIGEEEIASAARRATRLWAD